MKSSVDRKDPYKYAYFPQKAFDRVNLCKIHYLLYILKNFNNIFYIEQRKKIMDDNIKLAKILINI